MATQKKTQTKIKKSNRPKTRGAYDRERVGIGDFGESRTIQEFKAECDINNIMAHYNKTGIITHVNRREAQYGYCDGHDFADAMRIVTEAQEMFDDLPSEIRKHFNNDPGALLAFVSDPENAEEMIELGLREAPAPDPDPVRVEVVPPPEPPQATPES